MVIMAHITVTKNEKVNYYLLLPRGKTTAKKTVMHSDFSSDYQDLAKDMGEFK